jgi:hypothetical protein
MSTLTRTRRMPAKYCLRKGGLTEIVYSATPEVIVVLPGTRWLEQRREREARIAAEMALLEAEPLVMPDTDEPAAAPEVDAELTAIEFAAEEEIASEQTCAPDEIPDEPLSWTDRVRIASTKLIRRQNLWSSAQF